MPIQGLKSAADSTKQIITLSSGIVTLTMTFAKEFKAPGALTVPWQLNWGLIGYAISIAAGVVTMLTITGGLVESDEGEKVDAARRWIRNRAIVMVLAFLAAFALTVCAGFTIVK